MASKTVPHTAWLATLFRSKWAARIGFVGVLTGIVLNLWSGTASVAVYAPSFALLLSYLVATKRLLWSAPPAKSASTPTAPPWCAASRRSAIASTSAQEAAMPDGSRADNLVKEWCRGQVRFQCPPSSTFVHYWDCPDIEVYNVTGHQHPLSEVTGDLVSDLRAEWGCPHGPARLLAHLHYGGTLAELLAELENPSTASKPVRQGFVAAACEADEEDWFPLHAANYPAPSGTVWVPSS